MLKSYAWLFKSLCKYLKNNFLHHIIEMAPIFLFYTTLFVFSLDLPTQENILLISFILNYLSG